MFKFNFLNNEESQEKFKEEKLWTQSEEMSYQKTINETIVKNIITHCQINIIQTPSYELKHFNSTDIIEVLKTSENASKSLPLLNAEENHSDLTTAVYEGGSKIWECTFDLLNYITDQKLPLKEKSILDLGCGTGLIGIWTLLNGAQCTFQDYNEDVLKYITVPNINVNIDSLPETRLQNMKVFSGDWQSFCNKLHTKESYDYIFTSETIYNTENYAKLHEVFEKLLKKNGQIYLAAKSYYFGVGGGVSLFQDYLTQQNIFKVETVWKCSEGVTREILRISFIKQ